MSNIKTYKIEHFDTDAEISIEIDLDFEVTKHEKNQQDAIKSMVEYWSGWQSRLKENNGDYILTFMKQIARFSFIEGIEKDWSLQGIKDYWDGWNEGFYPLPEIGIKIVQYCGPEIDWDDLSIPEIIQK